MVLNKLDGFFKSGKFFYIIAVILVISGGFLVYSPHVINPGPIMDPPNSVDKSPLGFYEYPLHVDGWNHISRAKQFQEEGALFLNPITHEEREDSNLEFGFHIILAFLSIILFTPLVKFAFLVPAIIYMIGALLLFLYFDKVLKKRSSGIFILLFLPLMKSNANILGNWFLVPVNTFLIFFSSFLLVYHLIKNIKLRNTLLVIIFIISFMVYPFIAVFILLYCLIYNLDILKKYFIRFKEFFESHVYSKYYYVILSAFIALILGVIYVLDLKSIINISSLPFVFMSGWSPMEHSYFISDFMHPIFILISIFGIYYIYKPLNKLFLLLSVINAYFILMSFTYLFLKFTILIPYQRILYFWQIFLIISLALAFGYIFKSISKFLSRELFDGKYVNIIFILLFLIFGTLLVFSSIQGYYSPEPATFAAQKILSDDEYSLIIQTAENSVVLTDNFLAVTIYPLTGNKVVNCINANIGCNDQSTYSNFMQSGCFGKESIAIDNQVDYVLSYGVFYCPSFKLIDSSKNYYLYEFSS